MKVAMSLLRYVSRLAAAAAVSSLLTAAPTLAAAQDDVSAVWVPKHIQFVYQGFTTHYSCDGLQDRIRTMLEKLGAHDLKVRQYGCVRMSGPTLFPGVQVDMRVLMPQSSADAANDKDAGSAVQAQWSNVVLMPENASYNDQGDCELIEQFKRIFLPLFATRNVQYDSTCVPHQLTLGTHLSTDVLMPPPKTARNGS
jgi:hypothetical protein